MTKINLFFTSLCIAISACNTKEYEPLWKSDYYAIYNDKVVQGTYEAKAVSPSEITSDYQSAANLFQSPRITFKFSINGKDNEMVSGMDHTFIIVSESGKSETPLIAFGKQFVDDKVLEEGAYLLPDTELKIRLDMRHVIQAFEKDGYFTTFDGNKLYKEDFKAVYVAGSSSPLIWDFDNLVNNPHLELQDPDKDGIYEVILKMNSQEKRKSTASSWKLSKELSNFPRYSSEYPLLDALYNMSLEEMILNVEEDGTFRTGAEWAGVWTRDVSYSIMLSLGAIQPKVSRSSLMRKVKNARIVQDTGTGGAYPVSTDRIIWAVAAWEVYKVTGEREWLEESFEIIRNTIEDDLLNAYNGRTGLFRGESSFLDWREQTYPKWMQPVDIYESETLGTNAAFYKASLILSEMAELFDYDSASEKYKLIADKLKKDINRQLWMEDKGYYGQYLYGRNFKILSPRSEALGEALCVLFDIADQDRQKSIIANTPVNNFGIPCIYPQIPNIPPYHNNGIWPFVQSFWSLAAAKAGNEDALTESLAAIYRPAALFLTNKENMVASSGDFVGTQINSDRQLWSVAGTLGMVYKVLFGINYQDNGIVFEPFIPRAFRGTHRLTNLKYRNATLDLEISGYGNKIRSITMDGKELANAFLPGDIQGNHTIRIVLLSSEDNGGKVNRAPDHISPVVPNVSFNNGLLKWEAAENVRKFRILRNGQEIKVTEKREMQVPANGYAEYQVVAIDALGYESFASEPLSINGDRYRVIYEVEDFISKSGLPYKGYSGKGFVEISKKSNTSLNFRVVVQEDGLYSLDFRYANGSGPTNTNNKCAIRSLKKDGVLLGTLVFPQRGTNEWSNWGYSNAVPVHLKKGSHTLTVSFETANENMNGEVNDALLDYFRITKLQ